MLYAILLSLLSIIPSQPIPPGQCEATGGDYGFAIVDDTRPYMYEQSPGWALPSADGRFAVVLNQRDEVVVQADDETVQLNQSPDHIYEGYYRWAPQGSRLLVLPNIADIPDDNTLLVYDFGDTVNDYTVYRLPGQGTEASVYDVFWSPDGRYLLTWQQQLTLWDVEAENPVLTLSAPNTPLHVIWSPSGDQVAYYFDRATPTGNNNFVFSSYVVIASTDGTHETYDLPLAFNWCAVPVLSWSPDEQTLSILGRHCDGTNIQMMFITEADARIHTQTLPVDASTYTRVLFQGMQWGGDAVYVAALVGEDRQPTLHAFPRDGTVPRLIRHFDRPLSFSTAFDQWVINAPVAVYDDHENGTHSLTLMHLNTSNSRTLVEKVDDMGDPDWSPNGEHLAIVHAMGSGLTRDVTLQVFTLADPQATVTIQQDALADIRHLRWSPEGDLLLFQGYLRDGTSYNSYLLDVVSGAWHVLVENAIGWRPNMHHFDATGVHLHWQDAMGTWHDSRFNAAGERVMDYPIAGDLPLYDTHYTPAADAYALILRENSDQQTLVIVDRATGEIRMRTQVLPNIGNPVWSPDESMLAFTHSMGAGTPTLLRIVDADGTQLWEGEWAVYVLSAWLPC